MTNATHTRGPWAIDGAVSAMNLDVIYGSGRIAMMECENDEISDEELLANARLIAAAPELLAALETLAVQADEDTPSHCRTDHFANALAEALAAIAKARGE